MLYDLHFLDSGQIFPPYSELERLETYRQNKLLFEHRLQEVFGAYTERIRMIVNKFNETDWAQMNRDIYSLDFDYFELLSIKTADMTVGDSPTITVKKREISQEELESGEDVLLTERTRQSEENLKTLCERTGLYNKLTPIVIDMSRYGDAVARIYTQNKQGTESNNFTVVSPELWFPIVDREVKENRLYDVLAWTECLNPEAEEKSRRYVLKTQIHSAGSYVNQEYELKEEPVAYKLPDGCACGIPRFRIVRLVSQGKPVNTGLTASAIRDFHNITASDNIFGINDYDRINAIVAELGVRYTLENLVLDKHTAPTLATDEKNFYQNNRGEWTANIGGVMSIHEGQYPQYVTWDASLQANHTMIEKLEKHLYSLSEMGAVLNDESFGASQGFEALETRMTNARLKARRLGSLMISPLKELICLLSEKGFQKIECEDLSVLFNDGLPLTENQEVNIASKKVGGGAFVDVSTILQEHFGKSKEEADAIAENLASATANPFSGNFLDLPPERGEVSDEEG